jgi:hypothetical protein
VLRLHGIFLEPSATVFEIIIDPEICETLACLEALVLTDDL